MDFLSHLSESDKDIVLSKTARFLADELFAQQMSAIVYNSQAALATRLNCSIEVVGQLFAQQRIEYARLGKKTYRVTEEAVLRLLRNEPKLANLSENGRNSEFKQAA